MKLSVKTLSPTVTAGCGCSWRVVNTSTGGRARRGRARQGGAGCCSRVIRAGVLVLPQVAAVPRRVLVVVVVLGLAVPEQHFGVRRSAVLGQEVVTAAGERGGETRSG